VAPAAQWASIRHEREIEFELDAADLMPGDGAAGKD
jgi:hypothetical protein